MKEFIRISKLVIGVIITLMSFMVLLMALCTVFISKWSWGGATALVASVAWLLYIAARFDAVCTKEEK